MISRLLISPFNRLRVEEIEKQLKIHGLKKDHPDLLYFPAGEKLGIEQARLIKAHFTLKPYLAKGRAAVLEDASVMTVEAQNAFLKTLEEPPEEALLILGAKSEVNLLPTIVSRCQIINLKPDLRGPEAATSEVDYGTIEKLLAASIEERFEYIEKLKEREEFLHSLVSFFRKRLLKNPDLQTKDFLKELIQAEEWAAQNVNIRAILEYLMLIMPKPASQTSSDMGSV